jgi:para-nitrobenzyl esterase
MKKIYSIITGGLLLLASAVQLNAQCEGGRYHDFVFPATPDSIHNVVYGYNVTFSNQPDTLKMTIFEPHGDTSSSRALIIWVHGGSFIGGDKSQMNSLCMDFSKMGYVTATINYRLLMTGLNFQPGRPDSSDAGAAVMRAVHDARAAIRYFRKNATVGGNTYKIDTNNIYLGGASAGAITALHAGYIDHWSEFPPYIDTTGITVGNHIGQPGLHGGLDGLSGNPGYSSKVKALISLSGAIADTSWMHTGDTPVISTHSVGDQTVPYGTHLIYLSPPSTFPIQIINGSSVVTEKANQVGIVNCFKSYPGNHHVPETANIQIYDTSLVLVRNFLEHFTCGVPLDCNYTTFPQVILGINDVTANDASIKVYPNPAYTAATVDLTAFSGKVVSIELYDALGRKVKDATQVKAEQYTITRGNLPSGIYFMNIIVGEKSYSKKIMFE